MPRHGASPNDAGECVASGEAHVSQKEVQPHSVGVPGRPFAIAFSNNGCWIFVSITASTQTERNGVAVMHRIGNGRIRLHRVIPLEPTLRMGSESGSPAIGGMVVTHDGKMLIATAGELVIFLDIRRAITGHVEPVLGMMKTQKDAYNIQANVTRDNEYLFVSDEGRSSNITVIDLKRATADGFKAKAIVGRIPTGTLPVSLEFSPNGKLLYSTSAFAAKEWGWPLNCTPDWDSTTPAPEGAIVIIDVEKAKSEPFNAVLGRVPTGCVPVRLTLSPDGRSIWVSVRNDDAVAAYDAEKLLANPSHSRIAWIPVGPAPVGIVITRDGKYVLNTNSGRFRANMESPQTVTVIDRERATLGPGPAATVGFINAGVNPRQLALSPDGRTIFLTNYLSKTVQLIDVGQLDARFGH
jgi:DNA-binding beta-propeller fold protein YncE